MATNVSLSRLRELLQLSSGSCELALEAATEILEELSFPASFKGSERSWLDWWRENCKTIGIALGYSQKAGMQMANAAALCEQDLPYDSEQLRKAADELVQVVDEIYKLHDSFNRATDGADCDKYNKLWSMLWNKVIIADADTRSLLRSESIMPIENPLTSDEERAKFCFEQWQSGKVYKEINALLKLHPEWEHFKNSLHVRGPINAWSKRVGIKPRTGNRGRPK